LFPKTPATGTSPATFFLFWLDIIVSYEIIKLFNFNQYDFVATIKTTLLRYFITLN